MPIANDESPIIQQSKILKAEGGVPVCKIAEKLLKKGAKGLSDATSAMLCGRLEVIQTIGVTQNSKGIKTSVICLMSR